MIPDFRFRLLTAICYYNMLFSFFSSFPSSQTYSPPSPPFLPLHSSQLISVFFCVTFSYDCLCYTSSFFTLHSIAQIFPPHFTSFLTFFIPPSLLVRYISTLLIYTFYLFIPAQLFCPSLASIIILSNTLSSLPLFSPFPPSSGS